MNSKNSRQQIRRTNNMNLTVNSVIKYVSINESAKLEVILWIDNEYDTIVTYDVSNKNSLPIIKKRTEIEMLLDSLDVTIIPYPFFKHIDEAKVSEKYKRIRDTRWNLIKDIVCDEPDIYIKSKRNKLIKNIMKKNGLNHHKNLYKYIRQYWINGKTHNALLPNYFNSGGKGKEKPCGEMKRGRKSSDIEGINITPEFKKIIEKSYDKFYNKTNSSLKQARQDMLENYFNEGYYTNEQGNLVPVIKEKCPTLSQFIYWGQKAFTTKETLIKREGMRDFSLNHRGIIGESTSEAYAPGRLFQVDATIADIYLVSRQNPDWIIGRPVVYMVIDVFSRLIVGFYVGLEGPSWLGAMMAIYNTTRNKVDLCKEYEIIITSESWMCNNLPENIIADRGEFESNKTASLKANLGVNIKILPPYRADWKGIVEQNFRRFNNKTIHWLPGKIKREYRIRGEKDYRLGALLNLYEFNQIIIHSILYFNNKYMKYYERDTQMIIDNVPPIPNELWKWGLKNRSGALKTYSEDIIKLNLMPSKECTLADTGLRFQNRTYLSQELIDSGLLEHIRRNGSISKTISYDPRNTDNVYINEGSSYIKLTATNKIYNNYYYEELECLLEFEKSEEILDDKKDTQDIASLNANINQIIETAKKREKEYNESDRQRIKNIKGNRKNEKDENRKKESWDVGKSDYQNVINSNIDISLISEDEEYVSSAKFLDTINKEIEGN